MKVWPGHSYPPGVFLNGKTIPNPNPRGEPVTDDDFYLIFNGHHEPLEFTLPGGEWGETWVKEIDTRSARVEKPETYRAGDRLEAEARSLVVLRRET